MTETVAADLDLGTLARIGQGRAAEVFALDDQRVLKAIRAGASADVLGREAAAMRAAHAAGMPVPNAYERVDIGGGRRGLIMDRAKGVDMLSQFASRPWTIFRAGSKLGRLHARLHETIAPPEVPSVKEVLADHIAGSDRVPAAARDRVLALLRDLPDGDRLCHLDYHPGNVMVDGKEMVVIDWPNAGRGDPLADVAVTTLALRGGTAPPGTSILTRLFAPIGRRLILGGYLRGYRRQRPIDEQAFSGWRVVAAAHRLTYGIAGEQAMLMGVIDGD